MLVHPLPPQLSDSEIEQLETKPPKTWWQAWRWHLLAIFVSIVVFCGGVTLRVLVAQQVRALLEL